MTLELQADERLLAENMRPLVRKIAAQATEIDRARTFPRENLALLGEHGYMGMLLPQPYGLGLTSTAFVVAVQTLAEACASTAWLFVVHQAAMHGLYATAAEELRLKYLPALSSGAHITTFAGTEAGSGATLSAVQTRAESSGDEYVLSGTKSFISGAGAADIYLVMARLVTDTPPNSFGAFIVEREMPGLTFGSRFDSLGMRGIHWGELILDNCRIPRANYLGDAWRVINAEGQVGMLGAAAISTGIAQAAFTAASDHAKQRLVSGQPLASREGIQFALAEMATSLRAMQLMVRHAAAMRDSKTDPYRHLLETKIFTSERAVVIVEQALRITGAHGYSTEFPLERYYRDVRAPLLHFQTLEGAKRALGRLLST